MPMALIQKESSGSQFYIVEGEVFNDEKLTMVEKRIGNRLSDLQESIQNSWWDSTFRWRIHCFWRGR